ncbi:MAG: M23 family metallopeptidase [Acidothermales bacterium]|nr:M23 family metallopeptidase [Acidothermales bacterium]
MENSPARRVPSHGTHLFGVTYAIDFVAVDEHGRSAPRSWRALLATERPERCQGFGLPVLTPATGVVVLTHDGEPDHEARRSQLALLTYALGQAKRVRAGPAPVAGNHVVIGLGRQGAFVLLAHLRRGSVRVAPGDGVAPGEPVGECGNSGNSTDPHVHVQVTASTDWPTARGLPLAFRRPSGGVGEVPWVPAEAEIVTVTG